jgi:hypothetical protein
MAAKDYRSTRAASRDEVWPIVRVPHSEVRRQIREAVDKSFPAQRAVSFKQRLDDARKTTRAVLQPLLDEPARLPERPECRGTALLWPCAGRARPAERYQNQIPESAVVPEPDTAPGAGHLPCC